MSRVNKAYTFKSLKNSVLRRKKVSCGTLSDGPLVVKNHINCHVTKCDYFELVIVKYVKRHFSSFKKCFKMFFYLTSLYKIFLLQHNNNYSSLLYMQLTILLCVLCNHITIVQTG